ncbi:MAG TPA: ParB/RepB/Spo0J family partition protein [Thermoanaerobaculia bacterium]
MNVRKGLPERSKMRHDAHFVEELVRRSTTHVGSMLPMALIDANPDQPRTQLGNLDELAASIREKGVLEPILVRTKDNGRYEIISGERRFRASMAAGLEEIPAIELDADDREVLEIALIENIQRKDLTPFEEAEGFYVLQQKFGYTHEKLAQAIGKSRTTITETLQLNDIPDRIRILCRQSGISSKSVLVQISRAGNEQEMERLVGQFAAGEATRADLRKQTTRSAPRKKAGRPKNFKFDFKDKNLPFRVNLSFKKPNVEKGEIISALRAIIKKLETE